MTSHKQRAFIEHYLQSWNATQAAAAAGYAHPNKQGPRLLVNVGIQAAIQERLDELKMGADEVLQRLAAQARGDMRQFMKISERWTAFPLASEEILAEEQRPVQVDGQEVMRTYYLVKKVVLDTDALMDPDRSRLIKKLTDSPKAGLAVEIYDAHAALVDIGRHHRLFTDRTEVDVNLRVEGLSELLDQIYGNPEG